MLSRAKKTRWKAVFIRAVACFRQLSKRGFLIAFFGALQPFRNAAFQLSSYPPLKGDIPWWEAAHQGRAFSLVNKLKIKF